MRGHRAVLLAVLLVLAGCGALPGATTTDATTADSTTSGDATSGEATTAPTADGTAVATTTTTSEQADGTTAATTAGTTTTTATTTTSARTTALRTPSPPAIEVVGGTVYREPGVVWARVVALLDRTGVDPPGRVVVRNLSEMPTVSFDERPFYDLFGVGRGSGETRAAGYAVPEEVVVLRRQAVTPRGEVTLAHEFAHVVQYRLDVVDRDRGSTTAARTLERVVVEGAASYVAEEYARRYAPEEREYDYFRTRYRDRTGARRLVVAPYWFGLRYYAGRVDGPARVREVYARPPRSAEEVLHGLAPGADPFEPPNVSVAGWSAGGRDRMGELWLRVALSTELNDSAAARAAAGWDGDRRVELRDAGSESESTGDGDGERAYAWALRFDDRANATEFRRLFGAWRDRRTNGRDGAAYRAVRPDDLTVVVLAGAPEMVTVASVEIENGSVRVSPAGGQASRSGTANTTSMPTSATAAPTPTSRVV